MTLGEVSVFEDIDLKFDGAAFLSAVTYAGSVDIKKVRQKIATLWMTKKSELTFLASYVLVIGTNPAKGKSIADSDKFKAAMVNCAMKVEPKKPDELSLNRLQQCCHELMVQTGFNLLDKSKEGFEVRTKDVSYRICSALECSVWGYLVLYPHELASYYKYLKAFSEKLGRTTGRKFQLDAIAKQNESRIQKYEWVSKGLAERRKALGYPVFKGDGAIEES